MQTPRPDTCRMTVSTLLLPTALNFDDFNTLTLLANYQKDHTNMELGLPAAGAC